MAKQHKTAARTSVKSPTTNQLYYGDNLQVLRDNIADESVDLIYLDPPFNSQASYNILFHAPTGEQSKAQIEAKRPTIPLIDPTYFKKVQTEKTAEQGKLI